MIGDLSRLQLGELASKSRLVVSIHEASTAIRTASPSRPSRGLATGSARSRRIRASASPRRSSLGPSRVLPAHPQERVTVRPPALWPRAGTMAGMSRTKFRNGTSSFGTDHDGRQTGAGQRWQAAPGRSPNVLADAFPPMPLDMNVHLTLDNQVLVAGHDVRHVSPDALRRCWTAELGGMLRVTFLRSAGAAPDVPGDRVSAGLLHAWRLMDVRQAARLISQLRQVRY